MPKQIQISSLAKLKSIQQTLAAMFAVGGASRIQLKRLFGQKLSVSLSVQITNPYQPESEQKLKTKYKRG